MNIITSQSDFIAYIKDQATPNGNLSIRGVARCCSVEHTSIIRDGVFSSAKLGEMLTGSGFEAGALLESGFPPQAVWLCIEYFAYESKAKAPMAKQLARTFGSIGIMTTLKELNTIAEPKPEPRQLPPKRDTIDYIEAAKALPNLKVNAQLRMLLEDALTDEVELMRNNKLLGDKTEYTIVKVRAKELGYKEVQIKNGSALGKFVAQSITPDFPKRIGDFEVNHYKITPQLDEVIHAYFR